MKLGKSKVACEIRRELAVHCKMCVLCTNYCFDDEWPLMQYWKGKEAHLTCVLKQPLDAFTENYRATEGGYARSEEHDLPVRCRVCTYPIVTPEAFRLYVKAGNGLDTEPMHAWCLGARLTLLKVTPIQRKLVFRPTELSDEEKAYWKRVMQIPVPVEAMMKELLAQLPLRDDRITEKASKIKAKMAINERGAMLDMLATCPKSMEMETILSAPELKAAQVEELLADEGEEDEDA